MLKSEFENIIENSISQEDYEKIETVYMHYPGIEDKHEIANLYQRYGMLIIEDMTHRAHAIKLKESELRHAQGVVDGLRLELAMINGL